MSETLQKSSLQAARSAIDRNAWQDAFDLYKQAPETQPLGPVDLEEFANAAWQTARLEDNLASSTAWPLRRPPASETIAEPANPRPAP